MPPAPPTPALRELTVAGTFEVGLSGSRCDLVFATYRRRARPCAGIAGAPAACGCAVNDALAAPRWRRACAPCCRPGLQVIDWTVDHATYFRAIRIEKTMMALILLLIVAVAAFNIVAMLVMVVTDKRTDIAILRTFGASPGRVMGIFITQGLVIGWLGVAAGRGARGAARAQRRAPSCRCWNALFSFQIMDADVYYTTSIPSDLHWRERACSSAPRRCC